MKTKRILSILITTCMLLSLIPTIYASAQKPTEWVYLVEVAITQGKNTGCKKKNAITATLKFSDSMEETAFLQNTNKSPTKATIKSTRAPWMLKGIVLKNSSKDSLWMYSISIKVSKGNDTYSKQVLLHYPGTAGNYKSGKPIDQDDGGPANYSVDFDARRKITNTDNFKSTFDQTYYLDPNGETGTITADWSGKIKDNYSSFFSGGAYNCLNESDVPTMKVKFSGQTENGYNVSNSVPGVTLLNDNMSYKINKSELLAYMNKNNMSQVKIKFDLQFPGASTKGTNPFTATTTINRRAFCVDSVSYSNNYTVSYSNDSKIKADNWYYNNNSGNAVTATVKIKTTNQFSAYANLFNNKTITLGEAYLKAGDGIKIKANETSVTTDNKASFKLTFNLPNDVESGTAGLTLVMNNTLIDSSGTKYYLWDSVNKKLGLSHYTSTRKIDRKKPKVAISAKSGVDLNKWNKTVTLVANPSDMTYSYESNPVIGYYTMYLYGEGGSINIYKYNDTARTSSASTSQKVPSGVEQDITLTLRDKVEGKYTLCLHGYDEAGNYFKSEYKDIKLDNKAPQVTVTEVQEAQKIDGTKGNKYDVKISDKSGTGRLYYIFTEKSRQDAPKFEESTNIPQFSGEMTTTLEKWAFIDQKDTEEGKVAPYLGVKKGKNFSGRMLYFAIDEAGNKTDVFEKVINIQNENTAYDITPKNVEKPTSSYDITITTNENNTVYYRWKKAEDNSVITEFKKYSGSIDTSTDEATKAISGVYTLECKIVPPSGTNIKYTSLNYVFDNEGPAISFNASTAMSGKDTQTIFVKATDVADVASATAKIITPDGKDISGKEEFSLNIENGAINQDVNITSDSSGSYALKVTATDTNGKSKTEISEPFLIRKTAPDGSVNAKSDFSYNDKPIITSENITLAFDMSESFINSSYAKDQALYYRVGTALGEYGEWVKACDAALSTDAINAKATADLQKISLVDGKNTLFVQSAICSINDDLSKISQNTIKTDEVIFYYDRIAPTAGLEINDIQTNENIEGKLVDISDNLGGEISVSCKSDAVTIGEIIDGEASITVSESVDTVITISDVSGNTADIRLAIYGIDKTPPTAKIEVKEDAHGARKDAVANVKVNDVLGETVKFAFIPKDIYTGGDIPEEYFDWNAENFKVSVSRSEAAEWDGESNITYNVQILGTTGEWYLGISSADSLGNAGEIVFTDNVLSATDAELSFEISASPQITAAKTIVTVKYNVPVYTLPQDKIVDANSDVVKNNTLGIEDFDSLTTDEKVEAANLELAKQYDMSYSEKYLFTAGENGEYDLYTVDDLGRTKHLKANVSDVKFNETNIKVSKAERESSYSDVLIPCNDEMIPPGTFGGEGWYYKHYIIVEPVTSDTLLLPTETHDYTNGLFYDDRMTESVNGIENESGEVKGYKKLVYRTEQINNTGEYGDGYYADTTERTVSVYAFTEDTDITGVDLENSELVSKQTAVVTGIDNTAPIVKWSVNPEVLTFEDLPNNDGVLLPTLVKHPTPGNVTFTITAQDKDSGIEKIKAFSYADENGDYQQIFVPKTDDEGNPTEYWVWDGSMYSSKIDEVIIDSIPVKVEYFGDGDKYGVKTLRYTFSDEYTVEMGDIAFVNSLGMEEMPLIGGYECSISTEGIIYKMPIEEGEDYSIKYYFENSAGDWEEITDLENTYYKNAKAVIDIEEGSRGEERGLYVSNNSRQNEKVLNSYQNEFTFKLRDKYGYTMDVPVSLDKFDTTPGEINYTLGTTEKTNTPYDITITATDTDSGIGSVALTLGSDVISLTQNADGTYSGKISQNGTYSITLYDNVGNKTAKSFNVKNIDTVKPTAEVTYSTEEYTARPVSATLYFSKPNVRITSVEPDLSTSSQDYSVNYSTSTITFTESGTVTVNFADDYGNTGYEVVTVKNIDKTPPTLEANIAPTQDLTSVSVSFSKSETDLNRNESEIYVTYGGITKPVVDENGNKNSFELYQNGTYTFKVHDKWGLSSFLKLEIVDIDTEAPKISSVSWSYAYDEFDGQNWVTKTADETITPTDGKVGYIVAQDQYKVTNQDVNVTVETDSDTRLVGSGDEYTTSKEKVYDQNGMFIFNTQKKNGLVTSYAVDIEIIDKTPPTIELSGGNELVFYENPKMNSEYDISMLKSYTAYDVFNGKKTDLTENVKIDWGGFNPNDLSKNTFDSSKPYTITYSVSDSAHNTFEVRRTIRLVGMYDTIALVNGNIPDSSGRCTLKGDNISISLLNFAGTAYVRYQKGIYTMGQMKKLGTMLNKSENGNFEVSGLDEGWYTFYIQTDKRDYFTLCVYLSE